MGHKWTLITVTYNSREQLERHWQGTPADRDFDWIVVDNGSTDGSAQFAKEAATHTIEVGENWGFSRGNNLGLELVTTPYTAFVNPDVHVPNGEWQAILSDTIEATSGIVAPQLLNRDGSEQPNARGLPFLSAKIRNRLKPDSPRGREYARGDFNEPTYCTWVMGAAVAGRTDMFRALGGWDESFFVYYEDHELGLRAWRNGIPVVLDPRVKWLHEWQRATTELNKDAWKHELASMKTFFSKHPEFLRRKSTAARIEKAIQRAGYGVMNQNLWRAVDPAILDRSSVKSRY